MQRIYQLSLTLLFTEYPIVNASPHFMFIYRILHEVIDKGTPSLIDFRKCFFVRKSNVTSVAEIFQERLSLSILYLYHSWFTIVIAKSISDYHKYLHRIFLGISHAGYWGTNSLSMSLHRASKPKKRALHLLHFPWVPANE